MDRVELAKVLGHQLKGIMLHSDLCMAYLLRKNKRCAFTHYLRALAETKTFMLTNEYIIDTYGIIVEPTRETKITIPADATCDKLYEVWKEWEHDTAEMYQKIVLENPTCKYWKKLLRKVHHELYL